jgi:FlaA1/EpsC-like NDP-sugar epimerase
MKLAGERKASFMKNSENRYLHRISRVTVFKRRAFFFISDLLLISLVLYASFWLRFNGLIPAQFKQSMHYYIPLALLSKMTFLMLFNLYDISWRFVSLKEIIRLLKALSLGSLVLGVLFFLLKPYIQFIGFPRSILFIDYILSIILIGLLRISKRLFVEGFKNAWKLTEEKTKILIVGAGNGGEQIAREMTRLRHSKYIPLGFVDDDPAKQGIKIHGIRVLGKRENLPSLIKNNKIDEVLIALPSASSKDIRDIVKIIRRTNMIDKIKILPSTTDLIDGKATLSDIHEVKLEDLLGRAPVKIDYDAIKNFISNKKILITGAGGSIGSEITKTILQFCPKSTILFDIDETELFYLHNDLKASEQDVIPVVGDIRDRAKVSFVFEKFMPQIVVHSAAYKHVPVLEFYPAEAVKTNILGTKVLAEASIEYGIEKFIFISTDKAINPTSVMGASKRVGEELLKIMNQTNNTKFISVRFGNVLGSRGSVIELFREQIKKGGPVTVTHPRMTRYFMVTSEAVLLVLEAAAIGIGGEVYVLDMGESIKILDLAKEMIRLSGYEPDKDIPIIFTKIRPGEKLYEEILSAEEGVESTIYDKIMMAKSSRGKRPEIQMQKIVRLLELSSQSNKTNDILALLKQIVPTYTPSKNKFSTNFW